MSLETNLIMKENLKSYIDDSIRSLEKAKLLLSNTLINHIKIDKTYFNEDFMFKINISEKIEEIKSLKTENRPTLYWFELSSFDKNKLIRDKYIGYRESIKTKYSHPNYRNTSAYKKTFSRDSTTLYVGKVERGFWGRIVTHLGYNKSIRTAGMQLFHWYDLYEYGDIKLNYIQFDNEMKNQIVVLEKRLSKELKPLVGRY